MCPLSNVTGEEKEVVGKRSGFIIKLVKQASAREFEWK